MNLAIYHSQKRKLKQTTRTLALIKSIRNYAEEGEWDLNNVSDFAHVCAHFGEHNRSLVKSMRDQEYQPEVPAEVPAEEKPTE